jgi:hypothetical protein
MIRLLVTLHYTVTVHSRCVCALPDAIDRKAYANVAKWGTRETEERRLTDATPSRAGYIRLIGGWAKSREECADLIVYQSAHALSGDSIYHPTLVGPDFIHKTGGVL